MTGGGCGDRFEYEMHKLEARTGCFKWFCIVLAFIGHFMGLMKKKEKK